MNIEKLKRLQSQVRIGGKGTPRRKKKVMHQTAAADDKKLQSSLKKLSVSTIPGIEEVNIIKDDLTVIHFNNPKAQASLSANTFAVTGHGETKKIVEMLPEILPQLGQETVVQLRMFANSMTKNQKEGVHGFESNLLGNTDEDDVPLLVSDFEEIAKKEDLNKEQMQCPTKESVLSAEMNSTGEIAPMQSTEKYPNSDNKAIDNAGSLIEPLRNEDSNVKSEMEVNNNNPKKLDKSDNFKEGHVKKDHNKPKNKASDQNETVCSINEPLQASGYNDKKVADVKETVKKNATKTSEKITAGTNVKEVNNKKGSSPSQHTKAELLVEPLHTLDYNVKTEVDAKRYNSKKSEKNTKKTSVPEKTGIIKDSNVKKEPKNKVTQAVTSSISQQQNEKTIQCNKLLPTKELKQDKSLNINADTWSKLPTNLENVTEQKDDQTMISNAQSNTHLLEQTKNDLIEQKTLIESNLTDDTLLFTDSNVRNLETSIKDTHQEKKNEPILSLENNNKDSQVVVSSLSSVLPNEELKKEKRQEMQYVLVSTNTLEKTIKNVEEIKDTALLDLESPEKKLDLDDTLNDTSKCDVQELVANAQILNFVIPDDKLCLDEKKGTDSQLIDPAIVFAYLPDPLQTNDIKSEEIMANTLIDKEKQIKAVEITQDTAVSSKFIEENPLEREASEKVLQSLHNITTHPDYVEISKDLLKTEGHNLLNTKNIPQNDLAKQAIDKNIKSQIHIDPDLAAKLTLSGPSQKKDVLKKDTGKPQLASPMKPDAKKPDLIVRPKQVSPPKSHTQQSSNTGTTPKTQQTTKSVSGSKSVRQEKPSAAPKVKQTLSTSIKSQATATASKPSTTQAKKTSVSSPSSDLSTKNSVAIKASSAQETAAPVKPRVDNNNQKETKKPKSQTVATSDQKKVTEDPPKSCQ